MRRKVMAEKSGEFNTKLIRPSPAMHAICAWCSVNNATPSISLTECMALKERIYRSKTKKEFTEAIDHLDVQVRRIVTNAYGEDVSTKTFKLTSDERKPRFNEVKKLEVINTRLV